VARGSEACLNRGADAPVLAVADEAAARAIGERGFEEGDRFVEAAVVDEQELEVVTVGELLFEPRERRSL
jgi:hypothetical protein